MRRLLLVSLAVILSATACADAPRSGSPDTVPDAPADAVAFKEAWLIIETNATDGDAGLQLFLDHDAWKSIQLYLPDGRKIVDVSTPAELADHGLTELFSESSEPPFDEFPFDDFKRKFPAGDYTFVGETIEGDAIRSVVTLSHDVPAGPDITAPEEEATLASGDVVVTWGPGDQPSGVEIVRYEVIVVQEDADPVRTLEVDLPPTVTSFAVPATFTSIDGTYKAEVLAKAANGNQTISEVEFEIG